jgi:hypothetical protein
MGDCSDICGCRPDGQLCDRFSENTLHLSVSLFHKISLISHNRTMFIKFILEDPLSTNDIMVIRLRY